MFKEEHIRSIDESRPRKRREVIRRQAVWVVGLILLLSSFAEAFAQSGRASEFLEWFGKTFLRSGPPPTLDDLKRIKKAWCALPGVDCSSFPQDATQVRNFGGIYSFPYLGSSAMFYNHQKRETVLLPPHAQDGIKKAVAHLAQQDWTSSKITAWLLPVSSNGLKDESDCYIYRSENGYVRIKYEGNTFSGEKVSVKVISENLPKKNQPVDVGDRDLNFEPKSMKAPATLCSHFDEFKAYWEGSFDL